MDRYKIGSGTLSLIMERYHAGGIPIEELQMMPPKEVELLFYPQKNIKKKDIPLPGIIELVYIVLQSVVKPGITGFFKIDLHIKCYIYLS